jgi:hypothetical protein
MPLPLRSGQDSPPEAVAWVGLVGARLAEADVMQPESPILANFRKVLATTREAYGLLPNASAPTPPPRSKTRVRRAAAREVSGPRMPL